ncbi:MAG: ribonuclease E/G [Candidatus Bipolaricaulota bacterium]|nr:ribonuclease E/G [Candidatus Bipolaricaulota bacterium]MCS7273840.1 ribonuclease E/G [Candidatus Bipolaricaulota bacterium]MDW8110742.1 ribonuclease E/G [Candidatus Bipolaricaulota bacterium]MDW8328400.1 ribonuclease E/G [Candidatus Bipolaricaulota bacterium]
MFKVRLRSVYGLALGALLHEHGWQIVQPSEELRAYLNGASLPEPFELQVSDRDDGKGVIVTGDETALAEFRRLICQALPSVGICTPPVWLDAIYLGLVRRRRAAGYEIDLGAASGFLPMSKAKRALRSGEALRVQVYDLTDAGEEALLTLEISVAGRFAVLSSMRGVGISREITDPQERERLAKLGRRWATHQYGVIWRTAAWGREAHELQREIQSLQIAFARLDDHPPEGIPGLLRPGTPTLIAEFPQESQSVLDLWKSRLIAPIMRRTQD